MLLGTLSEDKVSEDRVVVGQLTLFRLRADYFSLIRSHCLLLGDVRHEDRADMGRTTLPRGPGPEGWHFVAPSLAVPGSPGRSSPSMVWKASVRVHVNVEVHLHRLWSPVAEQMYVWLLRSKPSPPQLRNELSRFSVPVLCADCCLVGLWGSLRGSSLRNSVCEDV